MDIYVGTKIVQAEPMTEREFLSTYRNLTIEAIELNYPAAVGRDGYKVIYEDGYISWSPKATFEHAYRKLSSQEINLVTASGYGEIAST